MDKKTVELSNCFDVVKKRERVIVVGIRNDIYKEKGDFVFPEKPNKNNWIKN